jgi:uncharacterized protein (DUF2147 family)
MPRRIASVLAVTIVAWAADALAQQPPVLGRWLTESGRGVVEIYQCGDKLCGKLVWLIEPIRHGAPAVDDKNPQPELRNRLLCGMEMLGDFRRVETARWGEGWIYDPDSGKTYRAIISLENADTLKLRGYVGIPLFGETQSWKRTDANFGSC